MKTTIFLLTLVVLLTFISACSKNNDNLATTASQAVVAGTWRVSLLSDNGNNETADFAGYDFTFTGGGVLTVVKSGATQAGTWSVSKRSNKFNIDLGPKSSKPLGELTDDWRILSSSSSEIRLGNDNPSNNELVTFSKN